MAENDSDEFVIHGYIEPASGLRLVAVVRIVHDEEGRHVPTVVRRTVTYSDPGADVLALFGLPIIDLDRLAHEVAAEQQERRLGG